LAPSKGENIKDFMKIWFREPYNFCFSCCFLWLDGTIGPSTYSLHWNSLSWNWGCKNLSYYPLLGWIKWNITKDMIWVGLGGSPPFPPHSLEAFHRVQTPPRLNLDYFRFVLLYMKMQPTRVGSEQANQWDTYHTTESNIMDPYLLTSLPVFYFGNFFAQMRKK
jgi:hypothetical protein